MSLLKRKGIVNLNFRFFGLFLLAVAAFIVIKTFYPVAKAEISYQITRSAPLNSEIIPIDPNFTIIIPKINVNTKVIKNVNPFNSTEYQIALTHGVAHARGSALPGFPGNVFIFAHSATDWYQANQYNAVFYLINKLESGDQIIIYYQGSKYIYSVNQKKIVNGNEINYLTGLVTDKTLTLMTCWPPGTTLKRLVITAASL